MSKYIKLGDAIRAIDDAFDSIPMEQTIEILQARRTISSLPTIEVSEDNEPTWKQVKEYCRRRCFMIMTAEEVSEIALSAYCRGSKMKGAEE